MLLTPALLAFAAVGPARGAYFVGVDPDSCAAVADDAPPADVTYRPGTDRDLDGHRIPAADINPPLGAALLDHVEIALDGETGQALAGALTGSRGQSWRGTPYLGFITFRDGHAYLDGIAVEGLGDSAKARLCAGNRAR